MKIIVAGDYQNPIYSPAIYLSLKKLGHEVIAFKWNEYFGAFITSKIANKFHVGPIVFKVNRDLQRLCFREKPDLLFIYRGVIITNETIKTIREHSGTIVIGFNNDDPFSTNYPKYFWKLYLNSVPYYDHIFSFRHKNVMEYKKRYGISSDLFRMYYIKERNYKMSETDIKQFPQYKCDVLFVGHFENDGRDEYLYELVKLGIDLQLYGNEWEQSKYYNVFKKIMKGDIRRLEKDYNTAMNCAKICIVFFSHLNNDTYTTRCFEIPATEGFMLSEYTDDMAQMFAPNKEAVYFSDKDDFILKIKYYLSHNDEREKIAKCGRYRLLKDGYEVQDRAMQIIEKYEALKKIEDNKLKQ